MNGVLCIDKPEGFTSFDVVAKMRGIAKTRRIGHTGTLDPMATGVLPILLGEATKAADLLPDSDKRYEASFAFGYRTDTQDSTGTTLARTDTRVTAEQIEAALPAFTGTIMQVPPMYSAVKVNGRKLYELAREGREVERAARPITVYSLELLSFDETTQSGTLVLSCSKGTYVRTLIDGLGEALGSYGVMTGLRRTFACGFALPACITLPRAQELAAAGALESALSPVETLFTTLPRLHLIPAQARMFRNGVKLDAARVRREGEGERFAVYGEAFLGIARIDAETNTVRAVKQFGHIKTEGQSH